MATRQDKAGPEFIRFLGPLLAAVKELGGSGRPAEVEPIIYHSLQIPVAAREQLNKSGQPRLKNQIAWARYYLTQAGYLEASKRGVWVLTPKGANAVLDHSKALLIFKAVQQAQRGAKPNNGAERLPSSDEEAPGETTRGISSDYRETLIATLRALPPPGFERLCKRLLRESGFQQVEVTGRSGDGGIDGHGIVQLNPFVNIRVLFQCKRYSGSVSPKEVRDFRGTMAGRTEQGIILTTGSFTSAAREEASREGVPTIELVDVDKLVAMFEDLELGLKPVKTFEVDHSFFNEFGT